MTRSPQLDSPRSIDQLVDDALKHLQALGYSPNYRRNIRSVWHTFMRFMTEQNATVLSEALIAQFLAQHGIPDERAPVGLSSRQRLIRAVMRILAEFNLHGCFQRRRQVAEQVKLPLVLQQSLDAHLDFCRTHRPCSPNTLRERTRHLTRFLHYLSAHHVTTVTAIQPKHLSAFIASQLHLKPATVALIASDLRSFLRFQCLHGAMTDDLSPHIPTIRIRRDARLPTVWTREQVDGLLAAVDRSSPRGKRDYAILLLACRLGLRVGDIRQLCLEQLHWNSVQIEIHQQKTGTSQRFPMSEEIGQALIDYLRYARPVTDYREVFLRLKAPLAPFASNDNLYHVIADYRRRAGITLPTAGPQGMHTLRHTVASRLLEVGTPLEIIADVLGHRSLTSTQIYTKVDIDALRSAALALPEVDDV